MKLSAFWILDRVYRSGGVQKAAQDLGLAASSVSHGVKQIEEALAIRLFSREGGGLTATAAAVEIRPQVARIAADIESLYRLAEPRDPAGRLLSSSVTLTGLMRLIDVLELGSIRKAARKAEIGQPQMTRMLATVETRLGVQLVLRRRGGAFGTEAGLKALTLARQVRDTWYGLNTGATDRVRRNVMQWSLGSIQPATSQSGAARLLGTIAGRWHVRYPTPLTLRTDLSDSLIEGLVLRKFDAVIVDIQPDKPGVRSVELQRTGLSFCMPRALVAAQAEDLHGPDPVRASLLRDTLALTSGAAGLRQMANRFLSAEIGHDWAGKVRMIEVDIIPIAITLLRDHGLTTILPRDVAIDPATAQKIDMPPDYQLSLHLAWRDDARGRQMCDRIMSLIHARADRPRIV